MTDNSNSFTIGILAYGSLMDNPGSEISEIEIKRIKCTTPFNVEFSRLSVTRGNAPTLIRIKNGGRTVNAEIIVLPDNTNIALAKNILWRRELHKNNRTDTYIPSSNPTNNTVVVEQLTDFMNVAIVLFTSIGSNIVPPLTGELLANHSIASILSNAGQEEKDGLRYLLAAKRNRITTSLSDEYENQILLKTETKSLEEAIEKLDRQRMMG